MQHEPKLVTPGVIAAEIGAPLHRVLYVLSTRPAIRPVARAGTIRVYDRMAVTQVGFQLRFMDAGRRRRRGVSDAG